MNVEQTMVREFHVAFGHPVADSPALLSAERVRARSKWLAEEVEEFRRAATVEDQADAMIDLLYFALGTLVEIGVQGEPLFHIVQQANMAKLWPDGRARLDDDGKVRKPPAWRDPGEALRHEIRRQATRQETMKAS